MQFQTRDGRFAFEFARWGDVAKDWGLEDKEIDSPNAVVFRLLARFGRGPYITVRALTAETLANALIDAGEMLIKPQSDDDDYGDDDDDDDRIDGDDGGGEEVIMDRQWSPDMADLFLGIYSTPK